jgi:hypothetical protein
VQSDHKGLIAMSTVVELPSIKPRSTSRRQGLRKLSPDLISKARGMRPPRRSVSRVGLTFLGTAAFVFWAMGTSASDCQTIAIYEYTPKRIAFRRSAVGARAVVQRTSPARPGSLHRSKLTPWRFDNNVSPAIGRSGAFVGQVADLGTRRGGGRWLSHAALFLCPDRWRPQSRC